MNHNKKKKREREMEKNNWKEKNVANSMKIFMKYG